MFRPFVKRLYRRGVFLVLTLIVLAYLFTGNAAVQRVDLLLYDSFLNLQNNRVSDEVVVVAVDDASLHYLGQWPWSRRVHGQLLERLTDMGAKAVAFDILFAEAETADHHADSFFAKAIAHNANTVLSVAPGKFSINPSVNSGLDNQMSEVLPLAMLAESAAALGHVDLEVDRDGLCRSFYLYAGINDAHWPVLSLALLQVADVVLSLETIDTFDENQTTHLGWMRKGRYLIPFDSRPDAVNVVSAYRVLDGDEAASLIKDKYVFVGSTATGLGDFQSTPVSLVHQRMPGVELHAHVLSGLLQGTLISEISRTGYLVITLLVTALIALVMFNVGFPSAIIIFLVTVIGVPAVAGMVMFAQQVWFPPTAATVSLILGFPLWGVFSHLHTRRINRSLSDRMLHQSLHNATTDLPNQYALESRLERLGKDDGLDNKIAALMIINIQWSGSARGIVGCLAAESLLKIVAQRLRKAIRSEDMIVHLNGDDFGIFIEGLSDIESARQIANNLLTLLQEPLEYEQSRLFLTPRMGMSLWPRMSSDGHALLRDASMAMYSARVRRASATVVYSMQVAQEVEHRSQLEQALIYAIKRDEFEVYYQPQIVASDGRLVGVEALLRWHNPKLGMVYPSTFIPLAEHTGLISEIGGWVLRTACRQVQQWNRAGLEPLRLAVNLSPLQLVDQNLFSEVCETLEESGLDPGRLELEITESAVMQNLEEAKAVLDSLKELGVKLAIDDFGTGYSSLSNLQHFPLDRIKIDQSFIRGIVTNDDDREITLTIINMAKRLKLEVIAEGVESKSQVTCLDEYGCDEFQGFYFSQPLPAKELEAILSERGFFTASLNSHRDV
jgi:diguanylate cyclase (GGDEF)-like protein